MKRVLLVFSGAMLCFYMLLWGSLFLSPDGMLGGVVLMLSLLSGLWLVKPGWNIRPRRTKGYGWLLFCLLLASALVAAGGLTLLQIPIPYDLAAMNLLAMLPGLVALTGAEELLFRQVMFRWLEKRGLSGRVAVLATALAFGAAHLGPLVIQTAQHPEFYAMQSVYMVWVGVLLGEIRRTSASWPVAWAGHVIYNFAVLSFLTLAR